jgi:serine/threonine protein kinase
MLPTETVSAFQNSTNLLPATDNSLQIDTNLKSIPPSADTHSPTSPYPPSSNSQSHHLTASSTVSSGLLSGSLSLQNGLGRGTQAYSAPELFATTTSSSNPDDEKFYSFPIDIYSVGVTLYVMATGREPYSLARSSVHMMMAIRKGFWAGGMQVGIGPEGPEVLIDEEDNQQQQQQPAPRTWGSSYRGDSNTRSRTKGSGKIKFGNGEVLDDEAVKILCRCVEQDPAKRPTARELCVLLNALS